MQEFTFYRNGEKETVYAERWGWAALFKDGNELRQFGDDGVFHQSGEIDQANLAMMTLYKLSDHSRRIDIPWKDGMRLVHSYQQHVKLFDDGHREKTTVFRFGFKAEGRYWLNYVLPDDTVVLSDDINPPFNV